MKKKNNINVDKLHYQFNTSAYWLVLLSLVFTLISLFSSINSDDFVLGNSIRVVPDLYLGIEIAIGIIIMLVTFLTSERLKTYDIKFTYLTFVLGLINILRIFFIPFKKYFNEHPAYTKTDFILIVLELVISSILLFIAAAITLKKINLLRNYDKKEKNV